MRSLAEVHRLLREAQQAHYARDMRRLLDQAFDELAAWLAEAPLRDIYSEVAAELELDPLAVT